MSALVSQQRVESTQRERILSKKICIEIRILERDHCQQVKALAFDALIGVKAEYAGVDANMHVGVKTVIGPHSSTN